MELRGLERFIGQRLSTAAIAVLLVCFACTCLQAQTETDSMIEQEFQEAIKRSVWHPEPFHLSPGLEIFGGYDSNSLSTADLADDDFTFRVSPSIQAYLPVGNRLLLDFSELVDFSYYREQEELRGVFSTTRVGGVFGGRRLLFRVHDDFRYERRRPTIEYDFPVRQRNNALTASVEIRTGDVYDVIFRFLHSSYKILDEDVIAGDTPVFQRLNRTQNVYGARLLRHLTERTNAVVEADYERIDFAELSVQPDAKSYSVRGGFMFATRGNISGQAILGFKQIKPDVPEEADFNGLVSLVNVSFRVSERISLGALFIREPQPSVTNNNWFFIETRAGGNVSIRVTRALTLNAGFFAGINGYQRPFAIRDENGELVVIEPDDKFKIANFAVNYKIGEYWILSFGGDYLSRTSNDPQAEKDRLLLGISLSTAF